MAAMKAQYLNHLAIIGQWRISAKASMARRLSAADENGAVAAASVGIISQRESGIIGVSNNNQRRHQWRNENGVSAAKAIIGES